MLYYLFLLNSLVILIFTLGFMTDYSDLFGLQLEANKPIAEFYGVLMQGFIKNAFVLALIVIFGYVCIRGLEINKKIPDKFALVIAGFFLLIALGSSIWAIMSMQSLQSVYLGLNFEDLIRESGAEHIIQTRAFSLGTGLYGYQGVLSAAFIGVLASNHFTFMKKYGEVAE
ncbi:MAG: hypothetical protein R3Y63_09775 [Eubacteriales bacterium]